MRASRRARRRGLVGPDPRDQVAHRRLDRLEQEVDLGLADDQRRHEAHDRGLVAAVDREHAVTREVVRHPRPEESSVYFSPAIRPRSRTSAMTSGCAAAIASRPVEQASPMAAA